MCSYRDYDVPLTEQSHPFTENIDILMPQDIVMQIYQCEQQLFKGWNGSKGLYNSAITEVIEELITVTANIIKSPDDSLVVISGCGTSGRLGFIAARSFNKMLQHLNPSSPEIFQYLISGGDIAFFTSQERAEDNPHLGVADLKELVRDKKHVLLIGITCGLSAPYIAGQIDFALEHLDVFVPVIIGFNPAHLARDVPIEDWDKTFSEVVHQLEAAQKEKKGFLLNPIIGPEPITGSTRMKGGSATKLLLDSIFMAGVLRVNGQILDVTSMYKAYELLQSKTYSYASEIGDVIEKAGYCLNKEHHLYYIGDDILGMFSLLDASECPPTFGADLEDVRGFLYGGFTRLGNREGDISAKAHVIVLKLYVHNLVQDGPEALSLFMDHFVSVTYGKNVIPISVDYFINTKLPELTEDDMIIFLCLDGKPQPLPSLLTGKARVCTLNFTNDLKIAETTPVTGDNVINIELPRSAIQDILDSKVVEKVWRQMTEQSCKWILNAISTGAHIYKGKVFRNYMVDLRVSNMKLYHRAVAIIMKFTDIMKADAEKVLLRSIYDVDKLTPDIYNRQLGDHIAVASTKNRVVPVAIILAVTHKSVQEAHELINQSAIIRIAVSKCCHGNEALF